MNLELFARLIELLRDFGTDGELITKAYNDFKDLDSTTFVQSRLQVAAWLAKSGQDYTALQLIAEAAYYLSSLLPGSPLDSLSKHYGDLLLAGKMTKLYENWVAMTPGCQDAVDFHNANFAKDCN